MRVRYLLSFYVTAACGTGLKRTNNEDNLCIGSFYLDEGDIETNDMVSVSCSRSFKNSLLTAVCDGMGGESSGEIASQIAVRRLSELPAGAGQGEILALLQQINFELHDKAVELGSQRIGCTAAVLSVTDGSASVINVGDSRVYRLRGRKLERLSHDQSEVQSYIDAGLISEKKARIHPLRHKILQFLGMPDNMLQFEKTRTTDVVAGDVFLLCSDGLTECLEDGKIRRLLRLGYDAESMYEAAMKKGGVDNTTVIIVRVE